MISLNNILIALALLFFVVRPALWFLDIIVETIKRAFYREPEHGHSGKEFHPGCPKCELDMERTLAQMEMFRKFGI